MKNSTKSNLEPATTHSRFFFAAVIATLTLIIGSARADYQATVLSNAPVGYWRLNDAVAKPGNVLATNAGSLGAAGHGIFTNDLLAGVAGALPAQNSSNTAIRGEFYLDGNRVRIPYSPVWNTNAAFTVEFWSKPGQTNVLTCPAASVEFADPSTNQVVRRGWLFYQGVINADGTDNGSGWLFRIYNPPSGAAAQQVSCSTAMTLDTNKWYHVAGTYKPTNPNKGLTLYVNGVSVATVNVSNPYENVKTNTIPLTFGARADGDFGFFTYVGSLDEAAYYPFLLTSAQILAHYQAGTNNSPATPYQALITSHSPAGYWRFNEKLGPPAANLGSSAAPGIYLFGTTPGVAGPQSPAFTGFEAANQAVAISTNPPNAPNYVQLAPLNLNTNTVTMAAWVKPNGPQNPYAAILMQASIDGTYSGLSIGKDGGFQIGYNWNLDASTYDFPSTVNIPDGQWSFVAVSVGATQATIFAHNGTTLQTNVNPVVHVEQAFGGLTRIGQDIGDPTNYTFNGSIDEVSVFKRTMSVGELYTLYAAGKGGLPPSLFQDVVAPPNISAGETLFLSADAGGTPTLAYQWRKNGTNLPGATLTSYTKPGLAAADQGDYAVVITNAFGAITSSIATISIQSQTFPLISQQPADTIVYQNGYINLSVVASGGALKYRWLRNGSLINGATDAAYIASPADATNAGNYSVIVSNTVGSVLSSTGVVTVIVPPPGSYAATVVADSPVSWWRLGEAPGSPTFQDAMGRHHGAWIAQPDLGSPGVAAGNSAAYFAAGANAYGEVPFAADLNSQIISVECWVQTTNIASELSPLGSFSSSPNRKGYMFFKEFGDWWSALSFGDDFIFTFVPIGPVTPGRWTHLVFTSSPGDGWTVYLDGVRTGGPFSPVGWVLNNSAPFRIGVNVPGATAYDNYFDGTIDEVAVYPTVLSAQRILEHYQAALYGSNTSPVFLTQPASQTVAEGGAVTFSSVVEGTLPITLQWLKNGAPISDATNASLTLSTVSFADAGSYRLSATNSVGTSNSLPATLSVVGAPTYANVTNGLVVHLKFDGNYFDTSGRGNHGYPSNSPAIVAGKIGSGALSYATTQTIDTNLMETNYSSSFVDFGTRPDLQFGTATDFSVAMWVKFTGTPGDLPFFCNSDTGLGSDGYTIAPGFNTGGIGWSLNDYRFESGETVNDGNWHHVVVSIKRTGQTVTYLDGEPIDSRLGTTTDLDSQFSTVIGQTGTFGYPEAGEFQLDDLGVWRRDLSAIEAYTIWYVGQTYGRSFDSFGPVLLVIRPNGGNLELIWQSGTLQQADAVTGPWTNVPGASAPRQVVTPAGARKFYRVQL